MVKEVNQDTCKHIYLKMLRFAWPIGLLFPTVEMCVLCEKRKK